MARWISAWAIAIASLLSFPQNSGGVEGGAQKKDRSKSPATLATVSSGHQLDRSGKPTLALTFDDGPHATLTPKLLDILKEAGVRATFYVIGSRVSQHPEIIERMVREGHEIGNHTWNHPDLRDLGPAEIRRELQKTEDAIRSACGRGSFSMRPPYGAINQKVANAIPEAHRPIVMWTVDPLDWKKPGSGVVAQRLLAGAKPGAILLCHDIHPGTIDAIKIAIPKLIELGYTFSTVSEILTQTQVLDLSLDP